MLDTDRSQFRKRELHSTPETLGVRCHMCEHLACIEREKARVHRWGYYCDLLHRRFTFKELYSITKQDCPEHREIRRRFR